jgi:hypothetical protein
VVRRPADGGGQPEILYSAKQTFLTSLADATPDGRYLIVREISGQDDGVFRLDVSSLAPRKLELVVAGSPEVPLGRVVRMTPDGRWLLVSAVAGFNNGYVFAYPGTTGKPIQTLTNFLRAPFFSADGRMLYGHTSDGRGGLSVAVRPILRAGTGFDWARGHCSLACTPRRSNQPIRPRLPRMVRLDGREVDPLAVRRPCRTMTVATARFQGARFLSAGTYHVQTRMARGAHIKHNLSSVGRRTPVASLEVARLTP